MAKKKKYKKLKRWCRGFMMLVLLLVSFLVIKCLSEEEKEEVEIPVPAVKIDSIIAHSKYVDSLMALPRKDVVMAEKRRRPYGYRFRTGLDYRKAFPDLNDVQLATASKLGIPTIADRTEAVQRKEELVFIGESPFYVIDELDYSIPYLVPRASRLLDEICRSFIDSLASRGIPFHKLFVTSVLRTQRDVKRLRRVNFNASENSCHQYGTTFDIAYNKYIPVYDPEKGGKNVWPAELKQVLAEVLDDLRAKGTCYIKYEVRQPCFHITAR